MLYLHFFHCCFVAFFSLFLMYICYFFARKKGYLELETFILCCFPAKSRLHATVKSKELLLREKVQDKQF